MPRVTDFNVQTGTGAASAITLTTPAVSDKFGMCDGFVITGAGATGASVISVTLAGLVGGTQTFKIAVPAGAAVAVTPLVVLFPRPIPTTGVNTTIVLTVASFGAGNLHAAASLFARYAA